MSAIIKRRKVDESLYTMVLAEANDFDVGLVDIPETSPGTLSTKYALIEPVAANGMFFGPNLTAPEQDAGIGYNILSVGEDRRQAAWVADEVRRIMCDRDAQGALVSDLAVEEHTVMDREQVGPIGAAQEISGVYQAHDQYRVKVSRIP